MSAARWLNAAWRWKCAGELRAFQQATTRVAAAQTQVLQEILQAGAESQFARTHHLGSVRTAKEFQSAVPLSTYADYSVAVEQIAAGQQRVLTNERVRLFEPTSGSSGGEKLIPYTPLLRRQFQRGVSAWIADLLGSRPAVRQGRSYWSISPALGPSRRSISGIPIGFDDDAAYLGRFDEWALRRLLVMPSSVAKIQQLKAFRYCTLLRLLAADDLALISIWSPTFLSALLADLEVNIERIVNDLRRGTLSSPVPLPSEIAGQLAFTGRRARQRAETLADIFRSSDSLADKLAQVWPRLALISVWADASAAAALPELQRLFPHIEIQPKGLLATEGFVSFPLFDFPAAALALRSHFFEFQRIEAHGAPSVGPLHLAHELERGGHYRVVLTTGGGLYRYQLHDEVEVVDHLRECPLLRFLGKADLTSDLVGEKLAEPFVRATIERVLERCGVQPRFAMLAPVDTAPRRYRLFVQPWQPCDLQAAAALQQRLEAGLCENPHYRYAVGLGQLAPVEVQCLGSHMESAWHVYQQFRIDRGQKAGDFKPVALHRGDLPMDLFASLCDAPSTSSAHKPVASQSSPA